MIIIFISIYCVILARNSHPFCNLQFAICDLRLKYKKRGAHHCEPLE